MTPIRSNELVIRAIAAPRRPRAAPGSCDRKSSSAARPRRRARREAEEQRRSARPRRRPSGGGGAGPPEAAARRRLGSGRGRERGPRRRTRRPKPSAPESAEQSAPAASRLGSRGTEPAEPSPPRSRRTKASERQRRRCQGSPRPHGRGDDGVQASALRRPMATARRRSSCCASGAGQGGQARRAPRGRGRRWPLRPLQRTGRGAGRGRLRDGLRREERGVRQLRARDGGAHGLRRPALRVGQEDVPEDEQERERAIFEAQADDSKPPDVRRKIAEGRFRKWFEDVVLLEQKHVNTDRTTAGRSSSSAPRSRKDGRERRDPPVRPLPRSGSRRPVRVTFRAQASGRVDFGRGRTGS